MSSELVKKSADEKILKRKIEEMSAKVDIAIIYHSMRRKFLDLSGKSIKLGIFITSTGAAGVVISQAVPALATWLIVIAAVLSGIELVFEIQSAARHHEILYRKYISFSGDLDNASLQKTRITQMSRQLLDLEEEEPHRYPLVWVAAHNRVCDSRGLLNHKRLLSRGENFIKHFWPFANVAKTNQIQSS